MALARGDLAQVPDEPLQIVRLLAQSDLLLGTPDPQVRARHPGGGGGLGPPEEGVHLGLEAGQLVGDGVLVAGVDLRGGEVTRFPRRRRFLLRLKNVLMLKRLY